MHTSHTILCTLGPSSSGRAIIERLDRLGVNIFRINLSHTQAVELPAIIERIREATDKPICIDTEGAQVRCRYVENDRVFFNENAIVEVTGDDVTGTESSIALSPVTVIQQLDVGMLINIDFDSVCLQVVEKTPLSLKARVIISGHVGSNKAVTLDRDVTLPVMSTKDVAAVRIALEHGVNHFALSFASDRKAVEALRALVGDQSTIIAKVESRAGVRHVEEILDAADAILIDRGDLSREVSIARIPLLQKIIIQKANACQVPVYVATNLLESMVSHKRPTRAEANDVMNTLIDGADGLVLAAETAVGKYPTECVAIVSSMIDQYVRVQDHHSVENLLNETSSYLTAPHGGVLVDQCGDDGDCERAQRLPQLTVDETVLMDAEQIGLGTFSPIRGFMNHEELESVLVNYTLPSGVVWPLPILLQVDEAKASHIIEGSTVALTGANGQVYATMAVESKYSYDLEKLAQQMFGTTDAAHAGVHQLMRRGQYFLSGPVTLLQRLPRSLKQYELTPRQTRSLFEHRGWRRVVGFHTRNVIHRAHEAIQLGALEKGRCDGLFVHPVVGPKKKDDYVADAILKSYEWMMQKHYPTGRVMLGAFSTYSRYAGPREAIFTALTRKNFGCSHFIVGRDHAGVGSYYSAGQSQELFTSLGDIGIQPVFFGDIYYCQRCDSYVETCQHDQTHVLSISGSKARALLRTGEQPPDWFMRKDISELLLNDMSAGKEIFVR